MKRITHSLLALYFSLTTIQVSAGWQALKNIDGSNQRLALGASLNAKDNTSYCMIIGIIDQLAIIESPELEHPMYSMEQAFEISARRMAKNYPVFCHAVFTGVNDHYIFGYKSNNI